MDQPTRVKALAVAGAALALFTWLAAQVSRGATADLDAAIRDAIHSHAFPALTAVMRTVTLAGSSWFLFWLGAVLAWPLVVSGRHLAAVQLALAGLGAKGLEQVLKLAFRRIRPESFFDYPRPGDYGFPSGHAIMSACFFGMLAMILASGIRRRGPRIAIWIGTVILILAIGISRIYLGVHHPTDVLAGYAMAVTWLALIRAASSANPRAAFPA